jgi:negative regulator of sigma E activity
MTQITDEQLSAFLDGELPEDEMETVAAALENDPSVAARLETLASVDTDLKEMFATTDKKPIREDTMALIDAALGEKDTETDTDNVVAFKPKTKAAAPQPQSWWPQAVAASVALVIGLAGGSYLTGGSTEQSSTAVFAALDANISGEQVSLPSGDTLEATLTFAAQNGGYCREYKLTTAESSSRNVACNNSGDWAVVATVMTENAEAATGYIPASDSDKAINAVITGLIAGDVLSAEAERLLIKAGWK